MPFQLEPVMAWKTAIVSLRTVEAGAQVGYNGTFVAPDRMRLALLPIGYADGLNRKLSNRGARAGSRNGCAHCRSHLDGPDHRGREPRA